MLLNRVRKTTRHRKAFLNDPTALAVPFVLRVSTRAAPGWLFSRRTFDNPTDDSRPHLTRQWGRPCFEGLPPPWY